jgi:hypothetical protein
MVGRSKQLEETDREPEAHNHQGRLGDQSLEEVQAVPEAQKRESKPSGAQIPDCQHQDRLQYLHGSINAGGSVGLRPRVTQAFLPAHGEVRPGSGRGGDSA